MKWINASDRLPEKAKDISSDPGIIFRKTSRTNTFVCHTSIRSFSFMGNNLDEWEWLDETESPDSEAVALLKEYREMLLTPLDEKVPIREVMAMGAWFNKVEKFLNNK